MATQNSINQSTAGIVAYNGTGTFSGRTLTGTSNQVSISNGDGTGGNPTVALTSTIYVSGISFDSGSNTMSAYSEGTWTPTLIGAGVAGTTTYTVQVGYYTKIGNIAHIQYVVTCSAATGTGDANTTQLPFTVKNQSSGNAHGALFISSITAWPASNTFGSAIAVNNSTMIQYNFFRSANATSIFQMGNNAMNFQSTIEYQV